MIGNGDSKMTPAENGHSAEGPRVFEEEIPKNLSTTALEQRYQKLVAQSQEHSQALTQKLASSQSGQDLLHIGTSLSSLPPDLHNLLTNLHPLLTNCEQSEQDLLELLSQLVQRTNRIRRAQLRAAQAKQCAELYTDLVAAEAVIEADVKQRKEDEKNRGDPKTYLNHMAALERTAHVALCLKRELEQATSTSPRSGVDMGVNTAAGRSSAPLPSVRAPLDPDPELATCTVQLSSRIRNLETDVVVCLSRRLEWLLPRRDEIGDQRYLILIGHAIRGLANLGRTSSVEQIVLQACMPLIRQHLSMGRLDQGGGRGECAGLESLLNDICTDVAHQYGPVLRYTIWLFDSEEHDGVAVDLVTGSVWVPLVTALLEDAAGLTMAIFSAGIASIIHANYQTMDAFLQTFAEQLLCSKEETAGADIAADHCEPTISPASIERAQHRIFSHPKTAEFTKKWAFNLNIYYQLRFGDTCQRLNAAIDTTRSQGWSAELEESRGAITPQRAHEIKDNVGYELALFVQVHDLLLTLWQPKVILRPLTNRFLRGAVQLLGRLVEFCEHGMQGKIMFGETSSSAQLSGQTASENGHANGATSENGNKPLPPPPISTAKPYCWGDSERDVAAVAWELTILESTIRHDYVDTIVKAVSGSDDSENAEVQEVVSEILEEATESIHSIIDMAWNELIVNILTTKCSAPLSAVKGVAATYRMTNRPPPKQASPFCATILRPLQEFNSEFSSRTSEKIGNRWKQHIVVTVSDRYATAVQELIETVQRTEATLQNRGTRRKAAGGRMTDGEKVKLQLFLDFETYVSHVEQVGVDPKTVIGISKLQDLTAAGQALAQRDGA